MRNDKLVDSVYERARNAKVIKWLPRSRMALTMYIARLHNLDRLLYAGVITEEEGIKELSKFKIYTDKEEAYKYV